MSRICIVLVGTLSAAICLWAQPKEVNLTISKAPSPGNPNLSSYGLRNVVPGIQYPDWFADPKVSSSDREYLVGEYNLRENLRFRAELAENSDPLKIQPIQDLIASLAGAISPESSQVSQGSAKAGTEIKPRDGYQYDQPSDAETQGDPTIETIDKELRWYSKKYDVPPSLIPDPNYRPTTIGPARPTAAQNSKELSPAEATKLLVPAAKDAARPADQSQGYQQAMDSCWASDRVARPTCIKMGGIQGLKCLDQANASLEACSSRARGQRKQ